MSVRWLAIALLAAGCARDSAAPVVYEPYAGEAYPNKRAKLPRPTGDLGITCDINSDTVTVIDFAAGKVVALGTALVASGAAALNQLLERIR